MISGVLAVVLGCGAYVGGVGVPVWGVAGEVAFVGVI